MSTVVWSWWNLTYIQMATHIHADVLPLFDLSINIYVWFLVIVTPSFYKMYILVDFTFWPYLKSRSLTCLHSLSVNINFSILNLCHFAFLYWKDFLFCIILRIRQEFLLCISIICFVPYAILSLRQASLWYYLFAPTSFKYIRNMTWPGNFFFVYYGGSILHINNKKW